MYVSHDRKLIFLANPKTASTSLARTLTEDFDFVLYGTHHSDEWMRQQVSYDEFKVFSVVRNPFDTVVSWVASQPDTALSEMPILTIASIRRALPENYVTWNTLFPHVEASDIIIDYGDLQVKLERLLGAPVELPRENVSGWRRGRHWRVFYDDKTYGYVLGRFEREILRFHYEF